MPTDTAPDADYLGSVDRFAELIRTGCPSLDSASVNTYALGLIDGVTLVGDRMPANAERLVRNIIKAAARVRDERAT